MYNTNTFFHQPKRLISIEIDTSLKLEILLASSDTCPLITIVPHFETTRSKSNTEQDKQPQNKSTSPIQNNRQIFLNTYFIQCVFVQQDEIYIHNVKLHTISVHGTIRRKLFLTATFELELLNLELWNKHDIGFPSPLFSIRKQGKALLFFHMDIKHDMPVRKEVGVLERRHRGFKFRGLRGEFSSIVYRMFFFWKGILVSKRQSCVNFDRFQGYKEAVLRLAFRQFI